MARAHSTHEYRINRALVLAASNVCWLCGMPGADTVDHVQPVNRGGSNSLTNLRPAHERCNKSKGVGPPPPMDTSREW